MSEILHCVGFWKHPVYVSNTDAEENLQAWKPALYCPSASNLWPLPDLATALLDAA